jgi:hypothetical protein
MRFLLFVSIWFLCLGCGSRSTQLLTTSEMQAASVAQVQPKFEKVLYRCTIDGRLVLKKFHLSGILYLKMMDGEHTRVVFQGEMGNTFFDFGWGENDSFQVYSIIDQMNKPGLIKTLRKDFEMLLGKGVVRSGAAYSMSQGPCLQFRLLAADDTTAYVRYYLNRQDELIKIENGDAKRQVVEMTVAPSPVRTLPSLLTIDHKRAGFTIQLNQINIDAE